VNSSQILEPFPSQLRRHLEYRLGQGRMSRWPIWKVRAFLLGLDLPNIALFFYIVRPNFFTKRAVPRAIIMRQNQARKNAFLSWKSVKIENWAQHPLIA